MKAVREGEEFFIFWALYIFLVWIFFVTSTRGEGLSDSLPSVSLSRTLTRNHRAWMAAWGRAASTGPADAFSEPSSCLLFFPAPPQPGRQSADDNVSESADDELMINERKLKFHLSLLFSKGLATTKTWLVGGTRCRSLSLMLDSVLNRLGTVGSLKRKNLIYCIDKTPFVRSF